MRVTAKQFGDSTHKIKPGDADEGSACIMSGKLPDRARRGNRNGGRVPESRIEPTAIRIVKRLKLARLGQDPPRDDLFRRVFLEGVAPKPNTANAAADARESDSAEHPRVRKERMPHAERYAAHDQHGCRRCCRGAGRGNVLRDDRACAVHHQMAMATAQASGATTRPR
jgi:hypothetical protein